ncbi:MAG: sigma-70 family RNA polymerase sigma factor [Longimicrobiales bacterium]
MSRSAVAIARSDAEIAQWHRELLRYVHRLTGDHDLSEDFAQEALLRLLSVDRAAPMHNARAWLYRVATNLVRDHARRSDMMRRRPIPIDADLPQTPEQAFERSETVAHVRAVLERLAPRDREVLVLRESGFRHKEIADIVEVKADSVAMLVSRALQRFRTAYLEEIPE